MPVRTSGSSTFDSSSMRWKGAATAARERFGDPIPKGQRRSRQRLGQGLEGVARDARAERAHGSGPDLERSVGDPLDQLGQKRSPAA